MEDVVEPMHSTKSADPSHAGEGTFETTSIISVEPIVIIFEEFSTNVDDLPTPPLQTLADIARPSALPPRNVS